MDPFTSQIVAIVLNQGFQMAREQLKKNIEHSKSIAIQKSLNELDDLIRIVDNRISKLENILSIEENYKQSDYYHLINKSFQSASNFPSKQKTIILSELIIKRIMNSPANGENNILSFAAERLEYLNIKHLKILAVLYALGINNLFDRFILELDLNGITPEVLNKKLSFLLEEKITIQDFKFMHGIGVIDILTPSATHNRDFIQAIFDYPYATNPISREFKYEFQKTEVGVLLSNQDLHIGNILMNPFGLIIGREAYKIFSKIDFT